MKPVFQAGISLHAKRSMDMTLELRQGSSRCMCGQCHQFFSGTSLFDAHRVGDYAAGRTCMTVKEMEAKGYVNRAGVWGWPAPENGRGSLYAPREADPPDAP
jgi:hypothetical protein